MKSLLKVFFLMYITLCLGVICIGCSKKNNVNETLKSEDTTSAKKSAVKESTIENSTVEASTVEDSSTEGSTTKDSSGTEGSDVNVESVDNSPWKLISESNVETSLFYAGFLNDKIGVPSLTVNCLLVGFFIILLIRIYCFIIYYVFAILLTLTYKAMYVFPDILKETYLSFF